MRTRAFRALSALTVLLGPALSSSAAAAPPLPFGPTCAPLDGALACPTASDAPASRASTASRSRSASRRRPG